MRRTLAPRRTHRRIAGAVARCALLVAIAAGVCASGTTAAAPLDPRVTIASIDAVALDAAGGSVDLTLTIENPAGVAVPVQALHFSCTLGDEAVARGESLAAARLPANGSARIPVRVRIDQASVVALSAVLSTASTLAYRIEGTADVGLTGVPVPFAHSGTITLGSAPGARVPS